MIRQKCHAGNSVASWRKTEISNLVRLAPENGVSGVMMIFSKLMSMFGKSVSEKEQPVSTEALEHKVVIKPSQPKSIFNIQQKPNAIIH